MRTSSCLLLLAVVTIIAVVYPVTTSAQQPWHPIDGEDIDRPFYQILGGWAVMEHVKQAHDGLKFSKVFSGEKQDLSTSVKYHFVIIASDRGGKTDRYDAELIEGNPRRLISFAPAN
ncbi:cysteine proteinase inhibitor 8 [Brachypodium distachyon]|uniref:Cystatin domain-containing protein n=1 Tax=Brachypodium distachyon TaxID=15368 RepID=A0A0Q3GPP5_BRADI|nr:cysteine proteinase inhibitor 8 [Brachypodium distachyon]KQK12960.1 hypothetical protein BRADI_1g07051v3 [Brachypodium distachyon]|eukprot:XP_010229475.1 cysteine proteinase inhibitor 8 [Brachypodium distachyon]